MTNRHHRTGPVTPAFLLILLLGVTSPVHAADTFAWAHPLPAASPLKAVTFADDLNGWAVGIAGVVVRTTDGGETWELVPGTFDVLPDLHDAIALDATTLVAVGAGAGVYRSVDAGASWSAANVPVSERLLQLTRLPGILRAGGEHGALIQSTDAGQTWTEMTSPGDARISDQHWFDANHGIVTAGIFPDFQGFAVRTDDGGASWTAIPAAATLPTEVVAFRDSLHGVLAGSGPGLITDDGGVTWNSASPQLPAYPSDIIFRQDGTLLISAFGEGAAIHRSPDEVQNWSYPFVFNMLSQLGVSDMERLPSGRLVAVMGSGGVLVSDDDGANWSLRTDDVTEMTGDPIDAIRLSADGRGLATTINTSSPWPPNLLLRTDDGGRSWSRGAYPTAWRRLNEVRLREGGTAFAIGSNDTTPALNLARSTDSGATWTLLGLPAGDVAGTVVHLSAAAVLVRGVQGGGGNQLWRSGDDGVTWTLAGTGGPSAAATISEFPTPEVGYSLLPGAAPRIYRTLDGGASWQLRSITPIRDEPARGLSFADAQTGLLFGATTVYRTTDAGMTWATIATDIVVAGAALHADGRGWIIGHTENSLQVTTDFGATWRLLALPWRDWDYRRSIYGLYRSAGLAPDGLVVGGDFSILLKVGLDAPVTAVAELPAPGATLHAAPNPFNPHTVLRFMLPRPGLASLEIHDVRGHRVRTLATGSLAAGEHSVHWDGRDDTGRALPSGTYLARVRGAGARAVTKVMLLK